MSQTDKNKIELPDSIRPLREDLAENAQQNARVWLEESPICTKMVDLDFNLQYMSAAGVKALELEHISDFYGKPIHFLSILTPSRRL